MTLEPRLRFYLIRCRLHLSGLLILLFLYLSLCSPVCLAAGDDIDVEAGWMDYLTGEGKIIAAGGVKVRKGDVLIESEKMAYDEKTSEAVAEENVRYSDTDITAKADRAEINMDRKTGRLFNAEILYKAENYRIAGRVIEKRGEKEYYSSEAVFTTCDGPSPAWCLQGRKVRAEIDETLDVHDATFRIKGWPVLYLPYLRAPLLTERKSGFLMPVLSYTRSKGAGMNLPLYWVVSDTSDATFYLDMYSRSGVGTGLEYRVVDPEKIKSTWWLYHIHTSDPSRDYFEARGLYDGRKPAEPGGFLTVNYVNEKDFYREFSHKTEIRTARFLESTGEYSVPYTEARLSLSSRYWIDLKQSTGDVPQRLPEIQYAMYSRPVGDFMMTADFSAGNFWREDGISSLRIDAYPKLLHSAGRDFVVSQTLGLRGTVYSYYNADDYDSQKARSAVTYDITGTTRFYKTYSGFTHVIEPSLQYHIIEPSEDSLPVMDSTELFPRTSTIQLSILNRGIVRGQEIFTARITQAMDTYNGDRPFLPLHLEAGLRWPLTLKMDMRYNVHDPRIETASADIGMQIWGISMSVGQRYNRTDDVMMFIASTEFSPYKSLHFSGRIWYDAKGRGTRDVTVGLRYFSQCWGIRVEATREPGDLSVKFMVELAGINAKPGSFNKRGLQGLPSEGQLQQDFY